MKTISPAELTRLQREQWDRELRAAEAVSSAVSMIATREGLTTDEADIIRMGLAKIGINTDAKRRYVIGIMTVSMTQQQETASEAVSVADVRPDDAEPGVQIDGGIQGDGETVPPADPVSVDDSKPIADMSKEELEAFAKERFGVSLDRRRKREDLASQVEELLVAASVG